MGGCASSNVKVPHEKRFKRAIKLYEVTEVKSLTNLLNRNKCFESGESPLTLAAQEGHEDIVQLLLNSGADVNRLDKNGKGALHVAIQQNDEETVDILLRANANPNKYDCENQSPLHVASTKGYASMAERLLTSGANVNATRNGLTPLTHAVVHGHPECVEVLLKYGADPNVYDGRGNTMLHVAVSNCDEQCTKLLLDYKIDFHLTSRDETPLLCLACLTACVGTTQILAKLDWTDVNTHRSQDPAAIIAATAVGSVECVDVLLAAGANPNVTDKRGYTPLQIAVSTVVDQQKQEFFSKYFSQLYSQYSMYDPEELSHENATKCAMSLVQGGAILDNVWGRFSMLFPHPTGITFEQMVLCEVMIQSYGFEALPKKKLHGFVENIIRIREYGLLKLLYSAGVDPTWDDQCNIGLSLEEDDREMFKWVKTLRTTPRTLSDLCRQTIRRGVSSNVLYFVESLYGLSQEAKDYVCIMDTEYYSIPLHTSDVTS